MKEIEELVLARKDEILSPDKKDKKETEKESTESENIIDDIDDDFEEFTPAEE